MTITPDRIRELAVIIVDQAAIHCVRTSKSVVSSRSFVCTRLVRLTSYLILHASYLPGPPDFATSSGFCGQITTSPAATPSSVASSWSSVCTLSARFRPTIDSLRWTFPVSRTFSLPALSQCVRSDPRLLKTVENNDLSAMKIVF